jgi:hypothetical protein
VRKPPKNFSWEIEMPGIILEIPDEIWRRAQTHFGIKTPAPQLRLLVWQCAIKDGGLERIAPWANGSPVPSPAPSASVPKDDSYDLNEEVANLLGQVVRPVQPARPPAPPETPLVREYWSSDHILESDFPAAWKAFYKYRAYYWKAEYMPNGTPPEKTPKELEDILEDVEGADFKELSANQQNFLHVVRRAHRNWWKATQR